MKHPAPIRNLIEALLILPGIGRRTAERFAYTLLQKDKTELEILARTISQLQQLIKTCSQCFQFSEAELCHVCANSNRDKSLLCLVENGRYIVPVEQTGHYQGLYFCLGGLLNPLEGVKPLSLRLGKLMERLQKREVKEVLIALDMDTSGDATTFYIKKLIDEANLSIKVTRLARGLSTGAQLEYADDMTLISAIDDRKIV